jgi:Rhomboid family
MCFSAWSYLTLYLVAGIAGVAAALAWHPFAVGAGASGAILGLYGALLAVFLRCRKAVPAETWGRLSKGMTAFVRRKHPPPLTTQCQRAEISCQSFLNHAVLPKTDRRIVLLHSQGLIAPSYQRLQQDALDLERRTIIRLRDEFVINDEVLRRIQVDLDHAEARLHVRA